MNLRILLIVMTIFLSSNSYAQYFKTDSVSQAEISKLAFITGQWQSTGWMMTLDITKRSFDQIENIQFKLDSTAILIEGLGKANGTVIHNTMAIVSYNKETGNYVFQSYLQNGQKNEFEAEFIENKFHWYPNANMRYIIWINEKNQWYEIGKMKRRGQWFQFFEMTLNQVTQQYFI